MDTETYILTVYDDDGNPIGIPAIMGRGIEFIKRTSGDGSAGSTDEYTITYTDGTTSTYTVYNGKDAPDEAVRYTPQDLTEPQQAQARANIDAAAGITESASGEVLALTDAAESPLRGLVVYGKSTQDGTPTPDAPVPIVSVGDDGTVNVTVEGGDDNTVQTLPISTPDGLCGIPVTSGGNYTDANGQQWVCDEVDFIKGVRKQRIGVKDFDGTETWSKNKDYQYYSAYNGEQKAFAECLATAFCGSPKDAYNAQGAEAISVSSTMIWLWSKTLCTSADDIRAYFAEKSAEGNPAKLYYLLALPIETPLTADELAAYAALHTNYPNTTIYADDNAGLAVDYTADTKAYIDKKFAELSAAIVNE